MKRKVCLISEALWIPFDEGMKVFAMHLARHLSAGYEFLGITNHGADIPELQVRNIAFSEMLVSKHLTQALRVFSPDIIIYLPQASVTTNSFIRAWLLKRKFPSVPLVLIGLQPRRHAALARSIIRRAKVDHLFVQGKASAEYFEKMGLSSPRLLPSGVDMNKYHPVASPQKALLRKKYGVPADVFLLSHVGHLRASRNLELLKHAQRRTGTYVLMVASSYAGPDRDIKASLLRAGLDVRCDYMANLEEIYQMSDAYLFPVVDDCGAIEMPLTVLEALACGTPVICSTFGTLEENFIASDAVHFIRDKDGLDRAVQALERGLDPRIARELAVQYSWDSIFEQYLAPALAV